MRGAEDSQSGPQQTERPKEDAEGDGDDGHDQDVAGLPTRVDRRIDGGHESTSAGATTSMTSRRPDVTRMRAIGVGPNVGKPAGRAGQQWLVRQRVGQPGRAHAVDIATDGQQADQVADPTRQDHVGRPLNEAHPTHTIEQDDVAPSQLRQAKQPDIGHGVVRAQPAQRAEDDDAAGSMAKGGAHRELGVGGVLVARPRLDADAGGTQRHQAFGGDRIEIADQLIDCEPQLCGIPGTAVRGDDHARAIAPAGPGCVDRSSKWDGAAGDHDGDTGSVGAHAAALLVGDPVVDTVGLRMLTGRRSRVDSLRWYEPDQVPRVCGRSALSAPYGAPLSHLRAGHPMLHPAGRPDHGRHRVGHPMRAGLTQPTALGGTGQDPMAVASARRAMAMSSMASPTRTSELGRSRR